MKRLKEIKKEIWGALRVGWFLAFRQIRRSSKGTTALIIFIMVLTFLNLVVVSGLLVGLLTGSFKQFRESYAGDVIITAEAGRDYIESSPEIIAFLKNHSQVKAVSPRMIIGGQVLGTTDENPKKGERPNSVNTQVVSIDPKAEEALTGFSRFVDQGEPLEPGDDDYILIGANLIKEFSSFADANIPGLDLLRGVRVGDKVKFTIGTGENQVSKRLIVKGILKSKVDQVSARMFVTDSALRSMLAVNKEQYQEISVRLYDPAFEKQLVAQIDEFKGDSQARVQTADDAIPSFLRQVETTFKILGNALSSIALVVASITVFIVVFINAVTRRKFIGIMKGIGISPKAIQVSYIIQSMFYGAVGSAIGLFVTFALLRPYFDANPIDFPFSDGILVATPIGSAFRVLILLAVTLFAGYLPAKLIVRKNTLDSILGR